MTPETNKNEATVNLERAIAIPETDNDWKCKRCGAALGWCEPGTCDRCERQMNDVQSDSFESKLDPYFSSKAKDNDAWTRRSSIKLYGQWT